MPSIVTLSAGSPIQFPGSPVEVAAEIGRPGVRLVLMETAHGKTIYINPHHVVSIQDTGTVLPHPPVGGR